MIVCLALTVCLPVPALAAIVCNPSGTSYDALDAALLGFYQYGDTLCTLTSDVDSTLTGGNQTVFNRTLTLVPGGYRVFLNNTLLFNNGTLGAPMTVTFAGPAWFTYRTDGTTGANWLNNSLVEFTGSNQQLTASNVTIEAKAFGGTGVNASGILNTLNTWNITGSAGTAMSVPGHWNTVNMNAGSIAMTANSQTGINLTGMSNTLNFNPSNITAKGGKVWLGTTASGNTISVTSFTAPTVNLYNGSSYNNGNAWYFYNRSWSPSLKNMNVTINVSQSFPLAGNVTISANWTNVNGTAPRLLTNSTLVVSSTTGSSGGYIFNSTEYTVFNSFPATVEVNMTYGQNIFQSSYEKLNIGTVAVLNFNPLHSLTPGGGLFVNETQTTNWTTIPDFTAASNVTFVMDSGTPSYTLRGNLSFLDTLNLTDQATGTGLANLGTNLQMSATGNSVELVSTATGMSPLNRSAVLTVYPTAFTVVAGTTDLAIYAGTVRVYNQGAYNPNGYITANTLETGQGFVRLPVLHFTKYYFTTGQSSGGGGSSGGSDSGGGSTAVAVAPAARAASTGTTNVNVGGNSAITTVAVTGVGVNDIVVTSFTQATPPASVTAPAAAVYQYMSVIPARYTSISSVTFNFNVPGSWLAEKGITKNDVAMMLWDPESKTWSALQTTLLSERDGVFTYQSIGPHLSEFAIAFKKDAAVQAAANVTAIPTATPARLALDTPLPTTPPARTLVATPTTVVPPAVTTPQSGFPLVTSIILGVGVVVIVAGIFMVRRWYIRRQNPALFEELE